MIARLMKRNSAGIVATLDRIKRVIHILGKNRSVGFTKINADVKPTQEVIQKAVEGRMRDMKKSEEATYQSTKCEIPKNQTVENYLLDRKGGEFNNGFR